MLQLMVGSQERSLVNNNTNDCVVILNYIKYLLTFIKPKTSEKNDNM